MSRYSLSYSSIADIYATAEDEEDVVVKDQLLSLATDLEQTGTGYFGGEEYIYRDSSYGMEVLSMDDYLAEKEEDFND